MERNKSWERDGVCDLTDIKVIGSDGVFDFRSFVMAAGGDTAYIGMPQAVIEITSLKTKPKMHAFVISIPWAD